jgi:acylphosphatase
VGSALIAKRFFVSGVVQGVGYRYFVQRVASQLALAGFTRNLHDGRVEVYAIGSQIKLAELRKELERGPQSASVSGVAENDEPIDARHESGFSIEYDR